MKSLFNFKMTAPALVSVFPLVFLALPKIAQAVVPAPDGGYPGGNTAEGQNALFSLTTGGYNTAVGWRSLSSDTEGSFNTAIGAGTLLFSTGSNNTAFGAAALLFNTNGVKNTSVGAGALLSNTSGSFNTATGVQALGNNTGGIQNTATGEVALGNNTDGLGNTATGDSALFFSTGSNNTALGSSAGGNVTTANNVICIGANVFGADVSDSCFIGNIFGQVASGGSAVFINSAGKLGTSTSAGRFKEEIKPMEQASEALIALKPVTFRYKKEVDPAGGSQFGLVAEDVEQVNPDLVVRDKEGKPYSVRYDQVNAMLLNEFLKEHRKNQQQESKIEQQEAKLARQQKQIEALTAGLEKVSAQLEVSRPAPKTVLNN
jgi:hypothetical protein